LDFPGDLLGRILPEGETLESPLALPEPPKSCSDPADIKRAVDLLKTAQRPLLIVGKGAAYAHAEDVVNEFVKQTNIPILASPMGKGVVDDNDPHSVGPARSLALEKADVIQLVGARLNWILHFGRPPRFDPNVKIIQVSKLRFIQYSLAKVNVLIPLCFKDRHCTRRIAQQYSIIGK